MLQEVLEVGPCRAEVDQRDDTIRVVVQIIRPVRVGFLEAEHEQLAHREAEHIGRDPVSLLDWQGMGAVDRDTWDKLRREDSFRAQVRNDLGDPERTRQLWIGQDFLAKVDLALGLDRLVALAVEFGLRDLQCLVHVVRIRDEIPHAQKSSQGIHV